MNIVFPQYKAWFSLYSESMKAYQKHFDMVQDTSKVLDYRLTMLNDMQNNPSDFFNPTNWLEINRMVWEKALSLGQSSLSIGQSMQSSYLSNDATANSRRALRDYARAMSPIQKTVKGNARRLSRK